MPNVNFVVIPQRSNGVQFEDVPQHRATNFAVFKIETRFSQGREITSKKLVSRHSRRAEAELAAESHRKGFLPPERVYKLGKRMGK